MGFRTARRAVEPAGPTKRLTVDVPENNHTRFKALCAMQRKKMAEEVNAFIARRIAEAEHQGRTFNDLFSKYKCADGQSGVGKGSRMSITPKETDDAKAVSLIV